MANWFCKLGRQLLELKGFCATVQAGRRWRLEAVFFLFRQVIRVNTTWKRHGFHQWHVRCCTRLLLVSGDTTRAERRRIDRKRRGGYTGETRVWFGGGTRSRRVVRWIVGGRDHDALRRGCCVVSVGLVSMGVTQGVTHSPRYISRFRSW